MHAPFPEMAADGLETLQVNLGLRCNQSCRHCHVSAHPGATQSMSWQTQQAVLRVLERSPIAVLDLTGGSPELNPTFRQLVAAAARIVAHVRVRTNLTVLTDPGQEDLPELYAGCGVELAASLPCYTEQNVDSVRGNGAYRRSMVALRRLNDVGYGTGRGGLRLDLVYNPAGATLPPPQDDLEDDYRRELAAAYGIQFHHLLTVTNMPIGRFRERLRESGQLDDYLALLVGHHSPEAVSRVMCRRLLNVAPDGVLYDCDFNQALGSRLCGRLPQTILDFDYDALVHRPITTGLHCYGCTAGAGSSCMGALIA